MHSLFPSFPIKQHTYNTMLLHNIRSSAKQTNIFRDLQIMSGTGAEGNKCRLACREAECQNVKVNCQSVPAPISSKQRKLFCKHPKQGHCSVLFARIPALF